MNVESLYGQSLVWDAHAGIFPSPDLDLNILEDWHQAGVNYLSINVGFDVMDWQQTLATLAAYRCGLEEHTDRFQRIERVSDIERLRSFRCGPQHRGRSTGWMDEDNIKRVVRGVEELMQPPPAGVIGAIRNPERL